MSAIHEHFERLRKLLPAETVAQLERAYKSDKAADERTSRQSSRATARQARERHELQVRQAEALATYAFGDGETRQALRAEWPALVPRFEAIEVEEVRIA